MHYNNNNNNDLLLHCCYCYIIKLIRIVVVVVFNYFIPELNFEGLFLSIISLNFLILEE